MNKYNLLYCSRMCTEETFSQIFGSSLNKPAQQAQKYHRTLFKGFCENEDVDALALSSLPINPLNYKKLYYRGHWDQWNRHIYYITEWNIKGLKYLSQIYYGYMAIKKRSGIDKTVAIIDILNISYNIGIVKACKKMGIPVIGIITDLPEILFSEFEEYVRKKCMEIIKECDGYVLLTEAMNDRINIDKNKPYIVIEGQVDNSMKNYPNKFHSKKNPYVCLYSGSINQIHGIEYMVRGFLKANLKNVELHIYGEGDFEPELKIICEKNENIKYFGVKLIDEVIEAQTKATLLINPRPTNQEFVKYSFPSKNMEYMASGTPVLTTRLPGMPIEYYEYVMVISDETIDGICSDFIRIFNKDMKELHEFGANAKRFVLTNKNGKVQSRKILSMIDGII